MYQSTEIIKGILKEFSSKDVDYAIIRNYSFLFEDSEKVGKDLDIVVEEVDLDSIMKILAKEGFSEQPISPYSNHKGYWKYLSNERKLVKFHFHVGGFSGSYSIYYPAETILDRKKKIESFYVVSEEDFLINTLIHSKLSPGSKYYSIMKNLIEQNLDRPYILNSLSNILGKDLAKKVFRNYFDFNFKDLNNLRNKIKLRIVRNNILSTFKILSMSSIWKIGRIIKPSPLVAFMGMDGAGKTTTTQNLIKVLNENCIKSSLVYTGRGKNNVLPIQGVGRTYKAYEKKKKSIKTSRKRMIYSLSAPIFFFDLYLRYIKDILPKRFSKEVVVVDRYATDMLLMKHANPKLKKILYSLFPKPNMIVYLYNDTDLLYSRKPNHPQGDLERQEKLFEKIIPNLNGVVKVKSLSEEQTLKYTSSSVFNLLIRT